MTREIIVDSFAGGGGTSLGIEMATGRSPDIAINHDRKAVAMHAVNHPATRHYCENAWKVDPATACAGRPVGLFWASPDCTHHSKARGGKPVQKKIRGLPWVVTRWAKAVRPRVIGLENVEEFEEWGPLDENDRPIKERKGDTFFAFVRRLRRLGYEVEWRQQTACDFGAMTARTRLFLVARCDGLPIVWPTPTYGPHRPLPWHTAAECIDWSIPCPSIFEREQRGKKALVENTLRRLARGTQRFVIDSPRPYVVALPPSIGINTSDSEKRQRAAAFIAKHYGDNGQRPGSSLFEPLATITGQDHNALVTVTLGAGGTHRAEVRAFLIAYYGNERDGGSLFEPLRTITGKDRFALVMVEGSGEEITDIGTRMLVPRELATAQGFPRGYILDHGIDPETGARVRIGSTAQVKMIGNSVSPLHACAIVAANYTADAMEVAA